MHIPPFFKNPERARFYFIMSDQFKAYLSLHFCVVVWGFTAILGKLISLQALPLVWWRVLLCSAVLVFIIPLRAVKEMDRRILRQLVLVGSLIGIHWICFYGAIKLSNASVAVATMATTSFFSALTEPWILKRRVNWYELALGILILPGMGLVVGNINWSMQVGFAVGTAGAFLAAVFTALNKKVLDQQPPPPLVMSFVELFSGFCITSVFLPFVWLQAPDTRIWPNMQDWVWLLTLAGVCTLLPHYLTLKAMRHISAFATNLTINLEPVYGVFLAVLLFREDKELSPGFYTGVAIILVAVFSHPVLKKVFDRS